LNIIYFSKDLFQNTKTTKIQNYQSATRLQTNGKINKGSKAISQ
jgi:hypothetical protein